MQEVNKILKTKYNSDGLQQWIHIAENDGELQSFGRLVAVERRNAHSGVSMCAYCLYHSFAEQRLHEHHYHQPQLPPDYPQEQSEVQSQEVPVRVREW